jgi:hypothetical protein
MIRAFVLPDRGGLERKVPSVPVISAPIDAVAVTTLVALLVSSLPVTAVSPTAAVAVTVVTGVSAVISAASVTSRLASVPQTLLIATLVRESYALIAIPVAAVVAVILVVIAVVTVAISIIVIAVSPLITIIVSPVTAIPAILCSGIGRTDEDKPESHCENKCDTFDHVDQSC